MIRNDSFVASIDLPCVFVTMRRVCICRVRVVDVDCGDVGFAVEVQ